jgi:hypothetical protein
VPGVSVNIRPLATYLSITVTGDYSYEGLKDALLRVRHAVNDHQAQKMLIDCRGLRGNPSLRERFEMVALTLQLRINAILHGKPSRCRTAIVAAPPLAHPNGYGVRLLAERNLRITICETVDDAFTWLGISADTPRPQHPEGDRGAPA